MRRAFGLPQALLIILFIGSIVLIGIKYTKAGVKHYADTYVSEQARLFLQSTKEWALFQISGFDRSGGNCWKEGTISYDSGNVRFDANVSIERYYLADGSTCNNVNYSPIQTPESHGYILLKIIITDSTQRVKMVDRSIQHP